MNFSKVLSRHISSSYCIHHCTTGAKNRTYKSINRTSI
ncbi:MAG: zinc-finger domain-containing protein [Bacteroidaceae bacterium]|nr:zinc-finger domain-containing protein [Bacteroidaceae bacterium]